MYAANFFSALYSIYKFDFQRISLMLAVIHFINTVSCFTFHPLFVKELSQETNLGSTLFENLRKNNIFRIKIRHLLSEL